MKRLLSIVLLVQALGAGATHRLTYFVYAETQYIQGPWSRTQLLNSSRYHYLAVREYTDLFGTERIDLAEKMLQRLGEIDPGTYDWDYQLGLRGDTVLLQTEHAIRSWERVRNEVTATLTMNSFSAVIFEQSDTVIKTTLSDLTLPYFDLVACHLNRAETRRIKGLPDSPVQPQNSKDDPLPEQQVNHPIRPPAIWLILSLLLNLSLVILLLIKQKKK